MELKPKAFGLACGIVWGVTVFIASLGVALRGGTGEITGKLARFYIGYDATTITGAFVGLVYGFFHFLIMGMIFAALYNKFSCGNKCCSTQSSPDKK
ncbi:MAG TPA: hypothetical protein PLB62_09010 [Candidatus Sumerlaeota bacterium]|nr:hypothetical protein [Candidatus Sumerlaeota bacterium]